MSLSHVMQGCFPEIFCLWTRLFPEISRDQLNIYIMLCSFPEIFCLWILLFQTQIGSETRHGVCNGVEVINYVPFDWSKNFLQIFPRKFPTSKITPSIIFRKLRQMKNGIALKFHFHSVCRHWIDELSNQNMYHN